MNKLTDLHNMEPALVSLLQEIGISTQAELVEVGSCKAFARIRKIWAGAGITMLYALEGAILGVHYHALPEKRREYLLQFWHEYQNA